MLKNVCLTWYKKYPLRIISINAICFILSLGYLVYACYTSKFNSVPLIPIMTVLYGSIMFLVAAIHHSIYLNGDFSELESYIWLAMFSPVTLFAIPVAYFTHKKYLYTPHDEDHLSAKELAYQIDMWTRYKIGNTRI